MLSPVIQQSTAYASWWLCYNIVLCTKLYYSSSLSSLSSSEGFAHSVLRPKYLCGSHYPVLSSFSVTAPAHCAPLNRKSTSYVPNPTIYPSIPPSRSFIRSLALNRKFPQVTTKSPLHSAFHCLARIESLSDSTSWVRCALLLPRIEYPSATRWRVYFAENNFIHSRASLLLLEEDEDDVPNICITRDGRVRNRTTTLLLLRCYCCTTSTSSWRWQEENLWNTCTKVEKRTKFHFICGKAGQDNNSDEDDDRRWMTEGERKIKF